MLRGGSFASHKNLFTLETLPLSSIFYERYKGDRCWWLVCFFSFPTRSCQAVLRRTSGFQLSRGARDKRSRAGTRQASQPQPAPRPAARALPRSHRTPSRGLCRSSVHIRPRLQALSPRQPCYRLTAPLRELKHRSGYRPGTSHQPRYPSCRGASAPRNALPVRPMDRCLGGEHDPNLQLWV